MITWEAFLQGLYITILGVSVVFGVLIILALAMEGIGYIERVLTLPKKPKKEEKVKVKEEKAEVPKVEEKPKIEPKKLAIITAAILSYIAEKNAQLRPLPFKRKPSQSWYIYGLQTQMDEVENFNYELGKW
jgi:sodium pump decarboxylase gamma subunit